MASLFNEIMDDAGRVIDAAGVIVIIGGAVVSLAAIRRGARGDGTDSYQRYRRALGRSILLGLEFLVAADIIRTVAVAPTLESVGVLAAIVGIRTFLSFSLEVEITGRWPWQQRPSTGPPAGGVPDTRKH